MLGSLRRAAFLTLFTTSTILNNFSTIAMKIPVVKSSDNISFINASLASKIDEKLMETPGFSIDQLMELAGLSVASAVVDMIPMNTKEENNKVLLLAGPGNNGGDALVASRHLLHFGYSPTIIYPKASKGQLFINLIKQIEDLDIPIININDSTDLNEIDVKDYDLIVDGLFGFSFKGPAREPFNSLMQHTYLQNDTPCLSIDIPSGWNVDEGDTHQTGFKPTAVISLTAPKLCMKGFNGIHYIGGRFVPPKMIKELGLILPDYGPTTTQLVKFDNDNDNDETCDNNNNNNSNRLSAVFVTTPSIEKARELSKGLLERKLAACINVTPGVISIYEWENQVEEDSECIMMIKTQKNLVQKVTDYVKEAHGYDVPEVISLPIDSDVGNLEYLNWVRDMTKHN